MADSQPIINAMIREIHDRICAINTKLAIANISDRAGLIRANGPETWLWHIEVARSRGNSPMAIYELHMLSERIGAVERLLAHI